MEPEASRDRSGVEGWGGEGVGKEQRETDPEAGIFQALNSTQCVCFAINE